MNFFSFLHFFNFKVFDPYFSTKQKNSQKGMGLGLTLCYSIIKKHKGHIHLESEPGKGTTVIIYLPAFSNVLVPCESEPETPF